MQKDNKMIQQKKDYARPRDRGTTNSVFVCGESELERGLAILDISILKYLHGS